MIYKKIPAWAFRFLQSIPSVTMILSGMSNEEQPEKNLVTFAEEKLPQACLQCRSCEQACPQQIRISEVLEDFTAKPG